MAPEDKNQQKQADSRNSPTIYGVCAFTSRLSAASVSTERASWVTLHGKFDTFTVFLNPRTTSSNAQGNGNAMGKFLAHGEIRQRSWQATRQCLRLEMCGAHRGCFFRESKARRR